MPGFKALRRKQIFAPVQSLCKLSYSAFAIKVISQPSNCKSPGKEGQDKRRRDKYFISWLKDGKVKNFSIAERVVIILTWEWHEWVEARKPFLYKAEVNNERRNKP